MKTIPVLAALLAIALVADDASAQGWFTGIAAGQAKHQDYSVGGPVTTMDDTDVAGRLIGGFLVGKMHGVVASYVDLGTAYYAGPAFGGFTDSLSADGFNIAYLVGGAPGAQQRFALFGTIGIFAWDQDVVFTDPTGSFSYKDDGTSFSLSFGTEINLRADGSSRWGILAEWQRFRDVGDDQNSGHENDRDLVSIGVSYRFGAN